MNVQSGQTVVLGGLIQDSEERGRDRIPVLGDIPVLGNLFGTTNSSNIRTELIVFLTPRVIRNPEDARDVSEELRSRLRSLQPVAQIRALRCPRALYPAAGRAPAGAMPEPQVLVPPRAQQQPQPQLYGIEPAPGGQ